MITPKIDIFVEIHIHESGLYIIIGMNIIIKCLLISLNSYLLFMTKKVKFNVCFESFEFWNNLKHPLKPS